MSNPENHFTVPSSQISRVKSPLFRILFRIEDIASALTFKAAPLGLSIHTKEQVGSLAGVNIGKGTIKMKISGSKFLDVRASLVSDLDDPT